jgi:hypothetical protein
MSVATSISASLILMHTEYSRAQIMKLHIMQFSPVSILPFMLEPNTQILNKAFITLRTSKQTNKQADKPTNSPPLCQLHCTVTSRTHRQRTRPQDSRDSHTISGNTAVYAVSVRH